MSISPLKRRKPTKKEIERQLEVRDYGNIDLQCSHCFELVENLPADVVRVTCSRCVQRMVEPPVEAKPKSEKTPDAGWPKGWQLKSHFDAPDGKVYCRGREKPNEEIVELDRKSVSKVSTRKRKSAGRKSRATNRGLHASPKKK